MIKNIKTRSFPHSMSLTEIIKKQLDPRRDFDYRLTMEKDGKNLFSKDLSNSTKKTANYDLLALTGLAKSVFRGATAGAVVGTTYYFISQLAGQDRETSIAVASFIGTGIYMADNGYHLVRLGRNLVSDFMEEIKKISE